jgi:tRNA pseudouridine38-40 synthase
MKTRATYKICLGYNGTNFDGWAYQPGEGHNSVYEELRRRLATVLPPLNKLIVGSAGRTDAGVHAYFQVATCTSWTWTPPERVVEVLLHSLPCMQLVHR